MLFPRLRVFGWIVACAVLATVALTVSPTAPANAAMLKGLQDMRLVMSDDESDRALFWDSARRAKVKRVRVLVTWDGKATKLAPWQEFIVRRAAAEGEDAGARLFVGIYSAINRSKKNFRVTATTNKRFSRFTASMGRAFADLPLAGYLTWNEPNFISMWPRSQPRTWVKMSNAAYRSFKREDPDTPVLVGEPAPNARTSNAVDPGLFFRRALCLNDRFRSINGSASCRTKLLADGIAIHTHDFVLNPTVPRINQDSWTMGNLPAARRQIRALARAGRISSKAARNIHITEFAYRTSGSQRTSNRQAANWLRSAWALARRNGIKSFTWYQLQDPGGSHGWTSGMLTHGGSERPTWATFRNLR